MNSGERTPRDPLQILTPHASLQLSADGQLVAALGIGEVIFWNISTGSLSSRTVHRPEDTGFTSEPQWSWRGEVIALPGPHDSTAITVDAMTGERISEVVVESEGDPPSPWALALSPDGSLLASSLQDGTVRVHSVADGTQVAMVEPRDAETSESGDHAPNPSYTDDGLLVLSSGFVQCPVQFWSTDGSRLQRMMPGPAEPYHHFRHTPDGQHLLLFRVVDPDGPTMAVELRDGVTFALVRTHHIPTIPTTSAIHPGGTHVAWCARGRTREERSIVHVMDLETAEITQLNGHARAPASLIYTPDGSTLLSMDAWDGIRAWDHATAELRQVFELPG